MKTCGNCGAHKRVFNNKVYNIPLCEHCRQEIFLYGELLKVHDLPPKGEIHYDKNGKPICHICGKAYHKLMSHVVQKHGMTEREYKDEFSLDYKGILSDVSRDKIRQATLTQYVTCVKVNLLEKGKGSRYDGSHKGKRKRVSLQTVRRLQKK